MKQLVPTSLDEYIAEHKEGDVVTGRMTDVSGGRARVELGEGIQAHVPHERRSAGEGREARPRLQADLSSLDFHAGSQVEGRPGRGGSPSASRPAPARSAASASSSWMPAAKKIELELA